MAMHHVCEDCGWDEFTHIYRGTNVLAAKRPKLTEVLSQYRCTFKECSGYLPPLVEHEEISQQQALVGAHEN